MKTQNRSCYVSAIFVLLLAAASTTNAQQGYKKPPKEVLDILNAPVTPNVSLSPTRDNMLLTTALRNPPLADLAQPMLRLAGRRINPASNSPHRLQYSVALTLKRIADGSEVQIQGPPGAKISGIEWSDDGKHFAFLNTAPTRVELWVGNAGTGKIHNLKGVQINSVLGNPLTWMPDSEARGSLSSETLADAALSSRELGKLGEQYAAAYLEQLGYRLVAANFTLPVGRNLRGALVNAELDLIAYDQTTLCFIEVKTRASDWFAPPEVNIDLRKRRQIARAARAYRRLFELEDQPLRYDVVTIVLSDEESLQIDLLKNYFTL